MAVRLGGVVLQGSGHGDHFLDKRNAQVLGQRQAAGSGDDRGHMDGAKLVDGPAEQVGEGLLDVGEMPLVVGEDDVVLVVQDRDLDRRGSDVDPQCE